MSSLVKITTAQHHTTIQELYLAHHDWLVQWLRRRIHYPFSAADIVQDTFVKILHAKEQLFQIEEPRSYLVNTAKHILIDQHRRYTLERHYLETVYEDLQLQQHTLEQNIIEEAIQAIELLSIALKDCSTYARQAFLLYYFEGYTQTEIAHKIGKSLRTTQLYLAECLSLCYAAKQYYSGEDSYAK